MLNTYFGGIRTGRLKRLAYLGWGVLLGILGALIFLGLAFVIGAAEQAAGGDIGQAQARLQQQFGVAGFVAVLAILLLLGFANLNLIAKRIRDMGVPGWWGVLGLVILGGVIGQLPELAASIASTVIWLGLLLVPSNAFAGKPSPA